MWWWVTLERRMSIPAKSVLREYLQYLCTSVSTPQYSSFNIPFSQHASSHRCILCSRSLPFDLQSTEGFMDFLFLSRPRWDSGLEGPGLRTPAAIRLLAIMPVKPVQNDGIQQGQFPSTSPGRMGPQRRWIKRYRTEVAASLSSVLSTFAAVRPLFNQEYIKSDLS